MTVEIHRTRVKHIMQQGRTSLYCERRVRQGGDRGHLNLAATRKLRRTLVCLIILVYRVAVLDRHPLRTFASSFETLFVLLAISIVGGRRHPWLVPILITANYRM
jgi:hypothetical protein